MMRSEFTKFEDTEVQCSVMEWIVRNRFSLHIWCYSAVNGIASRKPVEDDYLKSSPQQFWGNSLMVTPSYWALRMTTFHSAHAEALCWNRRKCALTRAMPGLRGAEWRPASPGGVFPLLLFAFLSWIPLYSVLIIWLISNVWVFIFVFHRLVLLSGPLWL